jgi:hypothetical protein
MIIGAGDFDRGHVAAGFAFEKRRNGHFQMKKTIAIANRPRTRCDGFNF